MKKLFVSGVLVLVAMTAAACGTTTVTCGKDCPKQVDPVKVPTDDPPKPAVVAVPAPTTASTCEEVQTSCKNLVAHILAHEFINCGESGKICQARAQELANAANAKCGAAYQDCLGAKGLHDATKGATENWKGEWAAKAKAKAKAHVKSDDAGDKKDDGEVIKIEPAAPKAHTKSDDKRGAARSDGDCQIYGEPHPTPAQCRELRTLNQAYASARADGEARANGFLRQP